MINPPFAKYKMTKSDLVLTGALWGFIAGMYLMNVLQPCEDKVCHEEPSQTEERPDIAIPEISCIGGVFTLSDDSSELIFLKNECQRPDYLRDIRINCTDDCTIVEVPESYCAGYACESVDGPRIRARFCKDSSVSLEQKTNDGWGAYQPQGE